MTEDPLTVVDFSGFNFIDQETSQSVAYTAELNCEWTNKIFNHIFSFDFDFEVNPDPEEVSTKKNITSVILRVEIFNDFEMDIGYLIIESIPNISEIITHTRELTITTDYRPYGMHYEIFYDYGDFSGSSHFHSESPFADSPKTIQYYDGSRLWIEDFANITFITRHHFADFQVEIDHSGKAQYFLGDENDIATATLQYNSTIVVENLEEGDPEFSLEISPLLKMYTKTEGGWGEETLVVNVSSSELLMVLTKNSSTNVTENLPNKLDYNKEPATGVPYIGFRLEFEMVFNFQEIRTEIDLEIRLIGEEEERDGSIAGFNPFWLLLFSFTALGIMGSRKICK